MARLLLSIAALGYLLFDYAYAESHFRCPQPGDGGMNDTWYKAYSAWTETANFCQFHCQSVRTNLQTAFPYFQVGDDFCIHWQSKKAKAEGDNCFCNHYRRKVELGYEFLKKFEEDTEMLNPLEAPTPTTSPENTTFLVK